MAFDFLLQRKHVKGIIGQGVVIAGVPLGNVGEPDAEVGELGKLCRCQLARCETGSVQCVPELITRMRVVGVFRGGARTCRRAAKNQGQAGLQQVGQDVYGGGVTQRRCVRLVTFGPAKSQ